MPLVTLRCLHGVKIIQGRPNPQYTGCSACVVAMQHGSNLWRIIYSIQEHHGHRIRYTDAQMADAIAPAPVASTSKLPQDHAAAPESAPTEDTPLKKVKEEEQSSPPPTSRLSENPKGKGREPSPVGDISGAAQPEFRNPLLPDSARQSSPPNLPKRKHAPSGAPQGPVHKRIRPGLQNTLAAAPNADHAPLHFEGLVKQTDESSDEGIDDTRSTLSNPAPEPERVVTAKGTSSQTDQQVQTSSNPTQKDANPSSTSKQPRSRKKSTPLTPEQQASKKAHMQKKKRKNRRKTQKRTEAAVAAAAAAASAPASSTPGEGEGGPHTPQGHHPLPAPASAGSASGSHPSDAGPSNTQATTAQGQANGKEQLRKPKLEKEELPPGQREAAAPHQSQSVRSPSETAADESSNATTKQEHARPPPSVQRPADPRSASPKDPTTHLSTNGSVKPRTSDTRGPVPSEAKPSGARQDRSQPTLARAGPSLPPRPHFDHIEGLGPSNMRAIAWSSSEASSQPRVPQPIVAGSTLGVTMPKPRPREQPALPPKALEVRKKPWQNPHAGKGPFWNDRGTIKSDPRAFGRQQRLARNGGSPSVLFGFRADFDLLPSTSFPSGQLGASGHKHPQASAGPSPHPAQSQPKHQAGTSPGNKKNQIRVSSSLNLGEGSKKPGGR